MRPVLLELSGFASYRAKTTVDFRDADFFVLVGPTGAGKSTVIDAMVFALYGTVPRWNDRGAVAPALAPTVNRGVVRLIFDADGRRYVAARDIRRSGGKNAAVSVREARLERFVCSDATGDSSDDTVSLATGRDVTAGVEQVLGLNFAQFTQSVALPQGEFARFLHATDAERQAILKNLLGYDIYGRIQSAANSRATEADSRATTLAEQLAEYADATDQYVTDHETALSQLEALIEHVNNALAPVLRRAITVCESAHIELQRLETEHTTLQSVTIPAGVDALGTQLSACRSEVDATTATQRAIEQHDTVLRNQLAKAPTRHQLEQVLERWRNLRAIRDSLPTLNADAENSRIAHATAEQLNAAPKPMCVTRARRLPWQRGLRKWPGPRSNRSTPASTNSTVWPLPTTSTHSANRFADASNTWRGHE